MIRNKFNRQSKAFRSLIQRRSRLIVLLLLAIVIVFIWRNDLLFAFQRWRLSSIGCSIEPTQQRVTRFPTGNEACGKFWPHRNDSFERLKTLSPYFQGLEADIVFDDKKQTFQVHHPPVAANGLLLDEYLEFAETKTKLLWLDVKDLSPLQYGPASNYFLKADSMYHIRNNIIIESSSVPFVNKMAGLGFKTSYLVLPAVLEGIDATDGILNESVAYVSQEDVYVNKMKQRFPRKKILTWAIAFKNYFSLSHFQQLKADTDIAVVLVNIKSDQYR